MAKKLEFIAKEYQDRIIKFMRKNPRGNIWADMGMGKTSATLTFLEECRMLGIISLDEPALVIAPLYVARDTWPKEVEKWEHLENLKIASMTGTPLEKFTGFLTPAHIYTINFESIDWLIQAFLDSGREWPYKIVIADESTKLKGFRTRQGTKRAQLLSKIAFNNVKRWYNLTGLAAPNGIKDLWGQQWFVDGGESLGRTWTNFTDRWFKKGYDGFSIEPLPHAQKEVTKAILPTTMIVRAEKYFNLKEPLIIKKWVDIPKDAYVKYKEMEKEFFTEIQEKGFEAISSAAKNMKCSQLAQGAIYKMDDEKSKEFVSLYDDKLDALESIVEECAGQPLIVAYHFKHDLERLKKRFKTAVVFGEKGYSQDRWNAGKIPILLCHPASMGHGLNLQHGGCRICFFAIDWNLDTHEQIIGRIGPVRQAQSGYKRLVHIYYILARKTIDVAKMERLETKKSVQEILKKAISKRGFK